MFSPDVLRIEPASAAEEIERAIKLQVLGTLRRRGAVVGLSGGVDSSVVAALCVRALGAARVFGLLMPERDSSTDSLPLGRLVAEHLGIDCLVEDITAVLEATGCYERQREAIRMVFPEYSDGYRSKVGLPSLLDRERLNVTYVTIQTPSGDTKRARLTAQAGLQLVAATNFKQRVRKMMEYHHADRLHYAVAGTPNRLEYDQGFFVKQGDGAADFKPIAHLYKTQVYLLAEHLGVSEEIRRRPPTTDTYSMPQTQEEFFFALPYDKMDLCLYGRDHDVPLEEVAGAIGLDRQQVERVYKDIDAKRRASQYLRLSPLLVHELEESVSPCAALPE